MKSEFQIRYEEIARKFIKRDGLEELLSQLADSDFYTAPASTKYHDAHKEGLVKHSLNVFSELDTALREIDRERMESIAIVSLFHDICKIGYYKTDVRNTKDENGKWIQVPYYTVDDKLPLGHGDKSIIMLLQAGLSLTTEEMMAIRWHMGLSVPKEEYPSMTLAFTEFPLALELHIADMRATYYSEGREV